MCCSSNTSMMSVEGQLLYRFEHGHGIHICSPFTGSPEAARYTPTCEALSAKTSHQTSSGIVWLDHLCSNLTFFGISPYDVESSFLPSL
jgi:hypothetical protein